MIKSILKDTSSSLHMSLRWDGDNPNDLNEIYEEKIINLSSYLFPEDEFEFDFNIDYIFIFKE